MTLTLMMTRRKAHGDDPSGVDLISVWTRSGCSEDRSEVTLSVGYADASDNGSKSRTLEAAASL